METETTRGWTAVLGVDPGTTTGLALVLFSRGERPQEVRSAQLPWDEAADAVRSGLVEMRNRLGSHIARAVAVGERFTLNAHTAQRGQSGAEDAMGMLGVLRREARLAGVELARLQQASTAKSMCKDVTLRNLGLHHPGRVHANDAARHAVAWALTDGCLDPRAALG